MKESKIKLPQDTRMVLISGKVFSGKSTLASRITHDSIWHKQALADELKSDVASMSNVTMSFLETHKDLFRPLLQYYGTNIMRHLHGESYWVTRLKERIVRYGCTHVVTDDVRFSSEVFGFGECAPYLVRLEISLEEQVRRFRARFEKEPDMSIFFHESETALDDMDEAVWDCIVHVDGLTTMQVFDAVEASMRVDGFELTPPWISSYVPEDLGPDLGALTIVLP